MSAIFDCTEGASSAHPPDMVTDDTLTIRPQPLAFMPGSAACERRHREAARRIASEGLGPALKAELEELELLLHEAIIASLSNPLIETTYKRMHNYLRLLRLDRRLTAPLALRSLREHLEIILACRARDPDAAAAALAAHFTAALQRHMGLF